MSSIKKNKLKNISIHKSIAAYSHEDIEKYLSNQLAQENIKVSNLKLYTKLFKYIIKNTPSIETVSFAELYGSLFFTKYKFANNVMEGFHLYKKRGYIYNDLNNFIKNNEIIKRMGPGFDDGFVEKELILAKESNKVTAFRAGSPKWIDILSKAKVVLKIYDKGSRKYKYSFLEPILFRKTFNHEHKTAGDHSNTPTLSPINIIETKDGKILNLLIKLKEDIEDYFRKNKLNPNINRNGLWHYMRTGKGGNIHEILSSLKEAYKVDNRLKIFIGLKNYLRGNNSGDPDISKVHHINKLIGHEVKNKIIPKQIDVFKKIIDDEIGFKELTLDADEYLNQIDNNDDSQNINRHFVGGISEQTWHNSLNINPETKASYYLLVETYKDWIDYIFNPEKYTDAYYQNGHSRIDPKKDYMNDFQKKFDRAIDFSDFFITSHIHYQNPEGLIAADGDEFLTAPMDGQIEIFGHTYQKNEIYRENLFALVRKKIKSLFTALNINIHDDRAEVVNKFRKYNKNGHDFEYGKRGLDHEKKNKQKVEFTSLITRHEVLLKNYPYSKVKSYVNSQDKLIIERDIYDKIQTHKVDHAPECYNLYTEKRNLRHGIIVFYPDSETIEHISYEKIQPFLNKLIEKGRITNINALHSFPRVRLNKTNAVLHNEIDFLNIKKKKQVDLNKDKETFVEEDRPKIQFEIYAAEVIDDVYDYIQRNFEDGSKKKLAADKIFGYFKSFVEISTLAMHSSTSPILSKLENIYQDLKNKILDFEIVYDVENSYLDKNLFAYIINMYEMTKEEYFAYFVNGHDKTAAYYRELDADEMSSKIIPFSRNISDRIKTYKSKAGKNGNGNDNSKQH